MTFTYELNKQGSNFFQKIIIKVGHYIILLLLYP